MDNYGGFNLIRSLDDTTARDSNLGTMQDFNHFIDEINLINIPLQGRSFTYSNKRPNPTFSKLDKALLSSHWNDYGVSYDLRDLPATASDHVPLMLRLSPHVNPLRRTFRFETFWLNYTNIQEIVATAWESVTIQNPVRRMQQKIYAIQRTLRSWAQEKFQKRDTFLSRSKWVLRQLNTAEERRELNSVEFRLRISIREHIFILAADQETRWKQ